MTNNFLFALNVKFHFVIYDISKYKFYIKHEFALLSIYKYKEHRSNE